MIKKIFIIGISLIFIIFIINYGCVYKKILNIPCPGCGMTRAYKSLIHGDIKQAFYYHPLFWSAPIILIVYFTNFKYNNLIIKILVILFFLVYIIRLITNTLV